MTQREKSERARLVTSDEDFPAADAGTEFSPADVHRVTHKQVLKRSPVVQFRNTAVVVVAVCGAVCLVLYLPFFIIIIFSRAGLFAQNLVAGRRFVLKGAALRQSFKTASYCSVSWQHLLDPRKICTPQCLL